MSSTTPPPGHQPGHQPGYQPAPSPGYQPGGPGGWGPPSGFGEPPSGGPGRKRTATAILVAAVVLVLIAGSAVAIKLVTDRFGAAGPQAAEGVPSDAVFYVGIDLDPSAEQKINGLRFLNHFPAFKKVAGVTDAETDVRRTITEKILESDPCEGLTYDDDIEPWIGSKFAVAGMPPASGDSEPIVIGAVQVTDQDRARVGLEKIHDCDANDPDYGLAFAGDYAIIAETQAQADKYASAAESDPLSDDGDFTSDMESLGDLGVATGWVDIDGAVSLFGSQIPGRDVSGSELDFLRSSYQRAAMTLRFESDHAELATTVYGDTPDVDHGDNQVVDLPDSTVFAVSEAGGRERLAASWDDIKETFGQSGLDIDAELKAFEARTGLSVPADLETVLGDNILLAVDGDGFTADVLGTGDPSKLNLGARFSGDKAGLNDVYTKVEKLVRDETGSDVPLVKKETEDGFVIATNDSYADKLSSDGNLGDSDAFTSVVDDGASKEFVLFFNFDAVEDSVVESVSSLGAPAEFVDNVRPLQSVAITSETDGKYTNGSLVISVND